MNAVNLPLALLTIILRRFIDKFRATQGTIILKSSAPWFIDTTLVKSCMYAYMFFAGIYYTMKHMQRGTIVSLAKKCSENAVTIKNRKRAYSSKNRSSLVKNLVRGRDGQQKALRYIASMLPQETINTPAPNILTYNNDEKMDQPCQNFEQELSNYTANPYFEPTGIHRDCTLSLTCHRPRYSNPQSPVLDTLADPTFPTNEDVVKIDLTESKEATPVGLETITISDEIQPDRKEEEGKLKRKRIPRNCLTLRGRKILKNDLSFVGITSCEKRGVVKFMVIIRWEREVPIKALGNYYDVRKYCEIVSAYSVPCNKKCFCFGTKICVFIQSSEVQF